MGQIPPLRLLVVFEAVARLRSMREAASRLNVTQPAISQAIRTLEGHVGTSLFDRTTRPARLTNTGQQLARAVREGLSVICGTIDDIRASSGIATHQLTVSCTFGMATHWLMPRLPDFYARHPDIVVNVQAPPTDLPTILPGTDIALRYGTGSWTDGTTKKLFDEIVCPVGRPALVDRLISAGTGLEDAPLIHVRNITTQHWADWNDYFVHRGLRLSCGSSETFDNYVQAVQAALNGRGLTLGWHSITDILVSEGALAPWPDGAVDLGTAYYATISRGGASKTATAIFVKWLGLHPGRAMAEFGWRDVTR